MKKINYGFTLIELIIVVAIIGIIASIAYPSYQDYVKKTNRTAAKSFLMDIMQKEQQYLLDAREYADNLTELDMSIPEEVSKYYSISQPFTVTSNPPKVSVTATATGSQASDGNLTISSSGEKTGKW